MTLAGRHLGFHARDEADYSARVIAGMIAEMSLRECAFLDALWIRRNPTTVAARIKRRHQQFLSELLSYYCCTCELFLDLKEGQIGWFVDIVADNLARLATDDRFIMRPPYFVGDLSEKRRSRYARHIAARRSLVEAMPRDITREFLTARTALDIRELIAEGSSDLHDLSTLENQLARRLEWTALELIGERGSLNA